MLVNVPTDTKVPLEKSGSVPASCTKTAIPLLTSETPVLSASPTDRERLSPYSSPPLLTLTIQIKE